MLPGQVRLGRIFGIEIGLHFSWFVIAALLTMSPESGAFSSLTMDRSLEC